MGTDSRIDSEGRAEEVEQKKHDNLSKQKEGKNHWEESLASDSESAVCQSEPHLASTPMTSINDPRCMLMRV